MSDNETIDNADDVWFAIKTRQDFRAEKVLAPVCKEVLFPKERVKAEGKRPTVRAVIPHVLFVKTSRSHILKLETEGRQHPGSSLSFWIYRYPASDDVQVISESSIELVRLLTADDTSRCEIFNKRDFKAMQRVRITGGRFEGYEGSVVRVKKNKHVVVQIAGVCLLMLPMIHPDLLSPID